MLEVDREALIVLALVGQGAVEIMYSLIELAKVKTLSYVWFTTKRRGLVRMIRHLNPLEFENGYRVFV